MSSGFMMTATKDNGGGEFERAPAGNHPAVLVGLIDMGTQHIKAYKPGDKDKDQHKGFFVWELVTEKTKTGASHLIGQDLTLSLNEKAKLRAWVEARLGRRIGESEQYDIAAELGQPCLLTVVEKNGYPRVNGMAAVPKGMTVAAPTIKPFAWHLSQAETTGKVELPSWVPWLFGRPLGEHIKECRELSGKAVSATYGGQAAPPNGNGQTAGPKPAAPAGAAGTGNGSKPAAPPPTAGRFWVALGNGETTNEPLDAAATGHLLFSKGLTPAALVCLDGTQEWRPASTFGITLPM